MGTCVRLVVPILDGPENAAIRRGILEAISDQFGGATYWEGSGHCIGPNREGVSDKVLIVECSIGRWDETSENAWLHIAHVVRSLLKQESVFLSVRDETAWLVRDNGTDVIGG
jgi:hypothetical protein